MGGGGGSNRGPTQEEIRAAEQKAKEAMREGGGTGKRNVFISFASEDLDKVNLLRGQAKNENSNIEFNDRSLREPFDSEKAEYIKRGIKDRIQQSSVTIVYVSDATASSKWVNWEIQQSVDMGKKVVAMHQGDTAPSRLPKAIIDNKIPVIPWNQNTLAKAIKE